MAKEIKWSPEAEATFERVVQYLQRRWTDKEVANFVSATEKVLAFISNNPLLFRKSSKKSIHEALITVHNLLLYRVKSKHIELITFFDTRQYPTKKYKTKGK